MQEITCLILTSGNTEIDLRFKEVAEHILDRMGVHALRLQAHEQLPGERIKDFVSMTELIKDANFILVNISEQKPDLMYHIGYAHALGKFVMFYVSEEAKVEIPNFLAGYIYRVYRTQRDLEFALSNDIKRYSMRVSDEQR